MYIMKEIAMENNAIPHKRKIGTLQMERLLYTSRLNQDWVFEGLIVLTMSTSRLFCMSRIITCMGGTRKTHKLPDRKTWNMYKRRLPNLFSWKNFLSIVVFVDRVYT